MNEYDRLDMTVGAVRTFERFTYDAAGNLVASDVLGDMNCNGVANFKDISPFVLAITDPSAWQATYPGCLTGNGDTDGDGSVNFKDINPFVALLTGK